MILSLITLLSFNSWGNVNEDFGMLPLRFEETMKVGETKEFALRISNDMKTKKLSDYKLSIKEFELNKEGGLVIESKKVNERSLVPYVRLSNDKINIDAQKTMTVKVIVTIPKDYKKGSGYFIVSLTKDIDLLKEQRKIKNGAVFMKRVTGFFAINIKDNQNFNVEVSKAQYSNNIMNIELENRGESYLKTSAKAIILDSSNKKVGVFELVDSKNRPDFLNIPGVVRQVSAAIPASLMKNRKDLKVNVTISDVQNNYLSSKTIDLQLGK